MVCLYCNSSFNENEKGKRYVVFCIVKYSIVDLGLSLLSYAFRRRYIFDSRLVVIKSSGSRAWFHNNVGF